MNIEKEEATQQKYQEIAQLIGVDKPPKLIVDTVGLSNKGLVGLYQRNRLTGETSITLHQWDESEAYLQKITVVHEITHYLLDKQGYHAGAHGWPFLAVCAMLSHKANINVDDALFSNIKNWRGMTPLGTWGKHVLRARQIAYSKINSEPEKLNMMTAEEITREVLSTGKSKIPGLSIKLSTISHNYFAKTDGLQTLLIHMTAIAFILGMILLVAKQNIGVYFLYFSILTLSTAGITDELRSKYKTIRVKYWDMKAKINSHRNKIQQD
jgi:hypothetical protein